MSDPNLYAFVTAAPEVAAIAGDRGYFQMIPQQHRDGAAAYPCWVYQNPSTTRDVEMCSTSDVALAGMQVDCYGPDADVVKALARAIRRRIVDYSGPMGDVMVQRAQITADFDGLDPEPGLYRRTQLYNLWFVET